MMAFRDGLLVLDVYYLTTCKVIEKSAVYSFFARLDYDYMNGGIFIHKVISRCISEMLHIK